MKKTSRTTANSPAPIRSFDQYEERFFPALAKRQGVPKDPQKVSTRLIDEELQKLQSLLQEIK
jgi:hypothetical protein